MRSTKVGDSAAKLAKSGMTGCIMDAKSLRGCRVFFCSGIRQHFVNESVKFSAIVKSHPPERG